MREWFGLRLGVGVTGFVVAVAAFVVTAQGAAAGTAPGSLNCPLPIGNPTHYDLVVGTTVTCTIDGASDVSGQTTTTVFIKSSSLGNSTVTGTVSGSGASTQITFSWTAPSGGCFTTIVAYGTVGNNANNGVITPGGTSSAGFRYVDSSGNVVEVCGTPTPPAAELTVSKTAAGAFTRTFTWGITKSVDQTLVEQSGTSATFNYTVSVTHDAGADSGWKVTGVISVLNPNKGDAVASVTDAIADPNASCDVANGSNATIPALSSVDFSYACTGFVSPTGSEVNTGTAAWAQQTLSDGSSLAAGSATGTATVDWGAVAPTLVDNCAVITDTLSGLLGTVCSTDPSPTTINYSHTVTGTAGTCTDFDNKATFTTNTTETTGSDSKSVTLCVGADLTVTKTATPSFTRTYTWGIGKSVDKTLLDAGGTATYTVTVTETGFTDSGWQVTGNITVSNPNDWEAITADVTDAVDNGGSCLVVDGTDVSIAASSSVTLVYTCTWASAPTSAGGTNTATATWDATASFTPDGSGKGTATFAFTTPTATVNQTITVTDSFSGTLGTATATDTTPFTVKSFTYTRTFTPPTSGCQTVNNTATIVETGQTASASVRVCNTGALTMGFWQNKNGQGIISGASQAALGSWLRQFNPFSNAPSSGLATYAYNIIKAATCGGTTCNTMLRAQMLATALDVYFSDPSLGGNKISAPAPIGGVVIDLTHICAMIDGSGGSTCSGTYENVSSAFGGATSMTVMNMLLYQNTSDPLVDAGAVWYGQVKATQVLAKDAFDAINNQVAVSP